MYYVYVLQNEEKELYFGFTNDLKSRLEKHKAGKVRSTKGHSWDLVYYEAYKSKEDAYKREERIKQHGQAKAQLKRRISLSRQPQS